MQEYNYIPLDTIRRYEPEMERLKVSEVARSPRGFLTAYKKANGNRNNLTSVYFLGMLILSMILAGLFINGIKKNNMVNK